MLQSGGFYLATGLPWDIGAGSRGLSRRAVELLLSSSREPMVGVDAEWPLLLLMPPPGAASTDEAFCLGYHPCEGLEYETADRFGPEIEAAGGYEAWVRQMSSKPNRWAFRLQVADLIAQAVIRYS